jgi:hypothetical protein
LNLIQLWIRSKAELSKSETDFNSSICQALGKMSTQQFNRKEENSERSWLNKISTTKCCVPKSTYMVNLVLVWFLHPTVRRA